MSDSLLMLLEMIEEVLREQGEVVDLGTEADEEIAVFVGDQFRIPPHDLPAGPDLPL